MHVVVLGAGYAGFTLTRLLEQNLSSDIDLTLVTDTPDHLIQHNLHRVIRRPKLRDTITIPLESTLEQTDIIIDTVESVDVEAQTVRTTTQTVSYDIGAICLGTDVNYHHIPGARQYATPVKSIADVTQIRSGWVDGMASMSHRALIIGAGLSGVQVAGELAAMDDANSETSSITIVEQESSVAPVFSEEFQQAIHQALIDNGIAIETDTIVTEVDGTNVMTASETVIPYDQLIWTAGIQGPEPIGVDRPTVKHDLRLSDHTFILGDSATVIDAHGQHVPATAQSAVQQAHTVAENIQRLIDHEQGPRTLFDPELIPFTFEPRGWAVSIGDDAIVNVGSSIVTGAIAKGLKRAVDLEYYQSVRSPRASVEYLFYDLKHAVSTLDRP